MVIYIVRDTKVWKEIYIASDLTKTLRMFDNISHAIQYNNSSLQS